MKIKKGFARVVSGILAVMMALMLTPSAAFAQTISAATAGKGSITINNPTKGQTYTVYKLFDATYVDEDTVAYSTTKDLGNGTAWFSKDSANNVTAVEGADITTAEFKTWAENFGDTVATIQSDGTTPLTFQGLDYGYYYVKSSLGTAVAVNTTTPNVVMNDKNTPTPIEGADKKITGVKDANASADSAFAATNISENGHETTAKIGDKVQFQITFNATNFNTDTDRTPIYQYVVTDTATGIDIDWSTLQVSIKTSTDAPEQYDVAEHPVTQNGNVITIPWATKNDDGTVTPFYYNAPATVTLTYVGTLNSIEGSNTANIAVNTSKGLDTPSDHVYTAQFNLTKVDSANNDTKLSGAEFELYDAANGGNRLYVVQNDDGTYTVTTDATDTTDTKIVSGDNGAFTINGLKQGVDYYLKETKAPAGYTLPTELIKVNGTKLPEKNNFTTLAQTSQDITNSKGIALPTTGGAGTTLFTVVGSVLVIGAAVALVTRKRMEK